MEKITCGVSGHRPEKLPWGYDESDPRCLALKQEMRELLLQLIKGGCRSFICGMARGVDLYFLEILLELKEEYPLTLEAAVPCPSQAASWREDQRQRYEKGLLSCDTITVLEAEYTPGCMLRRNRYLVDHSDLIITVYDGSSGGTAATVEYAREKGVTILPLWR